MPFLIKNKQQVTYDAHSYNFIKMSFNLSLILHAETNSA